MGAEVVQYEQAFLEILSLIHRGKTQLFKQANSTLIQTYWNVGGYLARKVSEESWGKGVVAKLAAWLAHKGEDSKGFSPSNLWRMKQFYELYAQDEKLAPLVRELPVDVTGVFKDSYLVDFANLPEQHLESDLQSALVANLRKFLLELGDGFTYMGEKVRVQVGNKDFELDLLFFHRDLRCMVAFELKTGDFEPANLGQLSFYLEALDRQKKRDHENPTIGILLCKSKDHEVVEMALSRTMAPALVSEYETKMVSKELLRQKLHEWSEMLEAVE